MSNCTCNWPAPNSDDDSLYGDDGHNWTDIGHDHWTRLLYQPDETTYGVIVRHKTTAGNWCDGAITWDTTRPVHWDLHSLEPLDVSPSLLCHCGDHGFIQQGRWVPV